MVCNSVDVDVAKHLAAVDVGAVLFFAAFADLSFLISSLSFLAFLCKLTKTATSGGAEAHLYLTITN